QDARPVGLPVERGDDGGAEATGGIRPGLDLGAKARQELTDPLPELIHADWRIAAAVDVDEVTEIVEVGRQVGGDAGAQGVELDGGRGRERLGRGGHRPSLAAATLLSCADRATGRDPSPRR